MTSSPPPTQPGASGSTAPTVHHGHEGHEGYPCSVDHGGAASTPAEARATATGLPRLLLALGRLPRVVVFLGVVALFLIGVLVPTWGWLALALIAVLVATLLVVTWPALTLPERLMRTAVLALVVAVTVARAFPKG